MSHISTSRASYNRINSNIRIGSRKSKPQVSVQKEVLSFPKAKIYIGTQKPIEFALNEYSAAILRKAPYSGAEMFTAKEIVARILQGKPLSLTRNGLKCLVKKI